MIRSRIDKLFLAFVFLVPLLPRPTAVGPEKWVVPLLLGGLIASWFLFRPKDEVVRGGNLQLLGFVLGFPIVAYVCRTVVQGGLEDETLHIVSRLLFAVGLYVMARWACTTSVPKKEIFKVFTYGFIATGLITIFSGVTGIQILEEDSIKPSRFIGLAKSTGIYRSFGEFGIMGCIAWAYLLMFARDFKPLNWIIAMGIVSLAMLIAQSRNVYLAWGVVTLLFFSLRYVQLPKVVYASLAAIIILIPIGVETSLPLLKQTGFGNKIIGTGSILERNIDVRFDQFGHALVLLSRDPAGAVAGYPRETWRELMMETHGHVVAPHNHFLSNIVFLGCAGGGLWICGLYLLPSIKLVQAFDPEDELRLMSVVCLLGTIVGLSFYEGFFSLVVMVSVSLAWSSAYSYDFDRLEWDDFEGTSAGLPSSNLKRVEL